MRAVTAATAAEVLGVDRKTFDNLLLRIGESAAPRGKQGVERRVPVALIEELLLTRDLGEGLSIGARDAYELARRLLGRGIGGAGEPVHFVGSLHAGEFIQVGVDLAALRETLQARLEHAIETVVRRPRGRPPKAANAGPQRSDA